MSMFRQTLVLCAVTVIATLATGMVRGWPSLGGDASGTASCAAPAEDPAAPRWMSPRWMSQDEAKSALTDSHVMFVDARPKEEFLVGHLPGAVHALDETGSVTPDVMDIMRGATTLVAYCDGGSSCGRSVQLAEKLRSLGLLDVRVLEGGWQTWSARGYPAESGTCRLCASEP